jgi:hypothetical protein
MKKFIRKVFLFLAPLVILGALVIFFPPNKKSNAYLATQNDKLSLLEHHKSPGIILVGGSSLAFGMNSERIRNELKLEPVNFGLYAPIGFVYQMDKVIPHIRKGDIIIGYLEYEQYESSCAFGSHFLMKTIEQTEPSDIFRLRWPQLRPNIASIVQGSIDKINYYKDPGYHITNPYLYTRNKFNSYGDYIGHLSLPRIPVPYMGKNTIREIDEHVLDVLNEFKQKIEEKGALLYITFAPLRKTDFDDNITSIRKAYHTLQQNGYRILGTPDKYVFPDTLFFDTNYHLTAEGRDKRTSMFIQDYEAATMMGNVMSANNKYTKKTRTH